MTVDVRERRPHRRWTGAIAVIATVLLASAVALTRTGEPEERGFRLDADIDRTTADEGGQVALEHPVPDDLQAQRPANGSVPAALADAAWLLPSYLPVETWLLRADTVWRPTSPIPLLDLASEHITIIDGHRATWRPPPCDCPTVRVWMYGGSTTWGIHQRDEHTIASELARIAHEDGIHLIVENRGALSYLHWLEAQRFALDLTLDPPPDLVLFYDGVNETWATNQLSERRAGDVPLPIDAQAIDVWAAASGGASTAPPAPDSARVIGWDRGIEASIDDLARLTVERYDRSRAMSRATAAQRGIAVAYAWQPSRASRDLTEGEPHGDAAEERLARLRDQLQRDLLPDDVIDLVDVFDGTAGPIFTDDVHHNEEGARIVAEALYAALERDLRELAVR